jgi:hypothetical protein
MKRIQVWLCALPAVAALIFIGSQTTVWADDEDERGLDKRVERLEREVHQLAGHQDRGERPGPMMNRPMGRDAMCGPQACVPNGMRDLSRAPQCRYSGVCVLGTIALVLAVVHVLLAVWVFGDIRKRGEGSGIFVVLALLIGVPGTILYLLARIGDRKIAEQKAGN